MPKDFAMTEEDVEKAALTEFLVRETAKWGPLAKESGATGG